MLDLRRTGRAAVIMVAVLLALAAALAQPGRGDAADPTTYTLADSAVSMFHTWQGGDATSAVFENVPDLKIVWKWQDETWLPYVPHPKAPSRTKTDYSLANGDTLYVISDGPVEITLVDALPLAGEAGCAFVDGTALVLAATAQVITAGGAGTAFYIGGDEWLTAAHVVAGGGSIRLRTDTLDRAATVIGLDTDADLALLSASGEGLTALAFGDHEALRVGQSLGLAGYPVTVSGSPSVTDGLLSKVLEADGIMYLQTNAAANPGNSGAPLFTDCGAVVGVVVAKAVDEAIEGIAWAVALPTVEEVLPRLREGEGSPPSTSALEITAICNTHWDATAGEWRGPETIEACRAAGAAGLRTGGGWSWRLWAQGIEDWANSVYRFDGGRATPWSSADRAAFDALAPGQHTIEVREERPEGWTAWSAPYVFTVLGSATAEEGEPLRIDSICNVQWDGERWQRPNSAEACQAADGGRLRTGEGWHWNAWVWGDVRNWANVVYRFDGGAQFHFTSAEDFAAFQSLAPGQHTIEVREQRDGVWTAWSAPYTFTIRGAEDAAPLAITAFCNSQWDASLGRWQGPETAEDCRAAGADGLRTGEDWAANAWYRGLEDADNPREIRFDGGAPVRPGSDEVPAAFDALGPGVHTIEVREHQSRGWTAWSAPYPFTIRAPADATPPRIDAICNMQRVGQEWQRPTSTEACRTTDGGRLRTGEGWHWSTWLWNVGRFENIVYRFDGGVPFSFFSVEDFRAFQALAPGEHTIEARERRGGMWTVWSAPFTFTIRSFEALTITAFCNYQRVWEQWYRYATAEECAASAAAGLHNGEAWDIWITGVENLEHVRYSIDGGLATSSSNLSLRDLAPGQHTIEVRERRGGEWSAWSAPYTFTIRAQEATLAPWIASICNAWWEAGAGWQWPGSAAACEAAGATGLRTGPGWHWAPVVGGVADWDRVVYRFDGGAALKRGTPEDFAAFRALAPGQHTIEVREQRGGVWTAWSAPFSFTTQRSR